MPTKLDFSASSRPSPDTTKVSKSFSTCSGHSTNGISPATAKGSGSVHPAPLGSHLQSGSNSPLLAGVTFFPQRKICPAASLRRAFRPSTGRCDPRHKHMCSGPQRMFPRSPRMRRQHRAQLLGKEAVRCAHAREPEYLSRPVDWSQTAFPGHLAASFAAGAASLPDHHLNTVLANAEWQFGNRYTGTFGWFSTSGTVDPLLYAPGAVSGSANGDPRSSGYIANFSVLALAEPAACRAIHRIYKIQWRHRQLRWLGSQCQWKQHDLSGCEIHLLKRRLQFQRRERQ